MKKKFIFIFWLDEATESDDDYEDDTDIDETEQEDEGKDGLIFYALNLL